MKKTLTLIALLAAGSLYLAAETKVGVIIPNAILQNSARGKAAIARLQAFGQEKQQRFNALQQEIAALQKEAMNPGLAADARAKKAADLQAKQTDLKRFSEDAGNQVQARQAKEFDAIKQELAPLIEQVAKANGCALVLDAESAGVAYFEPAIDLTAALVKAYDAKYAKPAAPAPAPR